MSSMNVGNRYIKNIRMILKKNGASAKEINIYTDMNMKLKKWQYCNKQY